MTVVEAASGIGDADHGFAQDFAAIPHGRRVRPPEVKTEIHVAVVGQAAREPTLLCSHRVFPFSNDARYSIAGVGWDGSHR